MNVLTTEFKLALGLNIFLEAFKHYRISLEGTFIVYSSDKTHSHAKNNHSIQLSKDVIEIHSITRRP